MAISTFELKPMEPNYSIWFDRNNLKAMFTTQEIKEIYFQETTFKLPEPTSHATGLCS